METGLAPWPTWLDILLSLFSREILASPIDVSIKSFIASELPKRLAPLLLFPAIACASV